MRASLPSPGRFFLLTLIAFAIFGLGSASTLVTFGLLDDRRALAAAQTADAAAMWMTAADQFETIALADPFRLPAAPSGDAADVYFPDDPAAVYDCGPTHYPSLFDNPVFTSSRDVIRQAAECAGLDRFVEAAAMPELTITNAPGDPERFNPFVTTQLFHGAERAFNAILARAHLEIEEQRYRDAERDARAVVSAGRQFVFESPDMYGVFMGVAFMTAGLDHLRELFHRRGDRFRAEAALAARDSLDRLHRGWSRMLAVGQKTATFPTLLRYTVAAAENEGLPLGLRRTMVVFLGYGHVAHFLERMLGPDGRRVRALGRFDADEELLPAVVAARAGLDLSWFERREFARRWNL